MCKYESIRKYPSEHDAMAAFEAYFNQHRINIYNAYIKFGAKVCDCLGINDADLLRLVETHDGSMMESPIERAGFLANFYPFVGDTMPTEQYGLRYAVYEKGLKAHYDANPHHPEHWISVNYEQNRLESVPMEAKYVGELILDWVSKSMVDGIPVSLFWQQERGMKFIHPTTILIIDGLVDLVSTV